MFLVRQLEGISNPRHKSFSRYFYLMEILAYTKSFTLCFEIEDNQEVFVALFKLIFKVLSNHEPNQKVKTFMLDIMSPLITEADNVSYELLDVIFKQIVEPEKSQNPFAYELCRQLIIKTSDALSIYIKNFICSELVSFENRTFETTSSVIKIFDVMYELYVISPVSAKLVIPALEGKLQAKEESNRLKALDMLIKLLNDEFVAEFPQLWQQYKQRFADISPAIRKKCVAGSKNFLNNDTKHRDEIIQQVCARKRDSDEGVRLQVCSVVVDAARRDWKMVITTPSLFEILKERIMDTKYIIRKEALQGFSLIHKSYVTEYFQENQYENIPDEIKGPMAIVKNKILHGYYMKTLEDKILIERVFVTCLVPYNMETKMRMKVLFQLLLDLDEYAIRAFIELQRQQTKLRKLVFDWLKVHKQPNRAEITSRGFQIAANLPEQNKAKEFISKFSNHIMKDNEIMQCMEAILSKDISCLKCTEKIQALLKKTGSASATNFYFSTIKNLLHRIASVTVDREAIEAFVEIVETKQKGSEIFPLTILSQVFPVHFQNDLVLEDMLDLLKRYTNEPGYKENILKTFTHLCAYKSLNETFPQISGELMEICKKLALEGTPKQCKHAVTFMCNQETFKVEDFTEVVNSFETAINISNPACRTAITALGVISEQFGEQFQKEISKIIGRNIVRGLLLNSNYETQQIRESWIPIDDLPGEILCIMAACKVTVHWLYGLKNDLSSAQKTMKIYDALIITNGNIQEKNKINKFESAWVKLMAAKSVLKIAEHKIYRKSITPQHFLNLSKVLLDENSEFKHEFLKRLHKGLSRSENSLPLEYLALYVFGGIEKDNQLVDLMRKNFNAKMQKVNDRKNDKELCMNLNYLPLYGIALLTHSSVLNDINDILELRRIEKCLKFIIDPLIDNLESTNNIECIKKLLKMVKHSKNCLDTQNESLNVVSENKSI